MSINKKEEVDTMLRRLKGQSTLEYAMVIAIVVGALLVMQIYMRRGLQGKLRESTDSVGAQYSAGNVKSLYTTEQLSTLTTKDTFGLDESGGFKQGVYYNKVITPAEVDRKAEGKDAEKITKKLNEETLFP
jgi:hypothetical protein